MKIGFTGTREGMSHEQWLAVFDLLKPIAPFVTEFHHGDCVGADEEVHRIALDLDIQNIIVHPPTSTILRAYCQGHKTLKPKDYTERNHDIVNASEYILAAPNTKNRQPRGGTWQTIGFAEKAKNLWRVVFPDGIVVEGC